VQNVDFSYKTGEIVKQLRKHFRNSSFLVNIKGKVCIKNDDSSFFTQYINNICLWTIDLNLTAKPITLFEEYVAVHL
jgi:hypothetical protein